MTMLISSYLNRNRLALVWGWTMFARYAGLFP